METDALGSEICSLGAHIAAATCRWLLLIGEFDRRSGAGDWECRSTAHWLNWRCRMSLRTARDHVRVGRALADLPAIAEAFGRGELSYSKVRAVTRIATAENEADLVELARAGTGAHVDKVVACYRRAVALNDDTAAARQERRYLRWFHDDDGSLVIQARFAPEDGAVTQQALVAAAEATGGSAEPLPIEHRRADALLAMSRQMLAADGPGTPAIPEVTMHVDVGVLTGADPEGRCQLDDGPALAPATARRLSCDASVIAMLERDGEVLSVGRKTRSVPTPIRRALAARDGTCQFPGCDRKAFLQAHHVIHWIDGGETKLTNLLLLCDLHHKAVHEGGYRVERDASGAIRFRRPDGRLVQAPAVAVDSDVVELNRAVGLVITDETSLAGWCGETLDYGMAVDSLLWYDRHPPEEAA